MSIFFQVTRMSPGSVEISNEVVKVLPGNSTPHGTYLCNLPTGFTVSLGVCDTT